MALRKNILTAFGTNGSVYFFQFLTTVVVSRLLSPEQIGVFSVSMALVAILHALREFGIVSYIVQERELTDEKIKTVFATSIVVGWTLGVSLLLIRHRISEIYGNHGISDILTVLSLSFFAFPFGLPATAMLRREMHFTDLAVISVSASIGSFVITCMMAAGGYGAISLAFGTFAGSIIQVATALYYWPQHLRLRPSFKSWRKVVTYGAQSSLASLAAALGQSSPDLIIGKLLGFHDVAIFTRGRVLTIIVDRFTTTPIRIATLPEIANRLRDGKDFQELLLKVDQTTQLLGWSLLAFMFANANQIVHLLYGSQWTGSVTILQALCVSQAFLQLTNIPRLYLLATGKAKAVLLIEIAILFILVATVFTGSQWNLDVLSWLMAVASMFSAMIYWRSARKGVGITGMQMISNLRLPLCVALLVLSVEYLFDATFGSLSGKQGIGILGSLIAESILAASVVLGMLKFWRHQLYDIVIFNLRSFPFGNRND